MVLGFLTYCFSTRFSYRFSIGIGIGIGIGSGIGIGIGIGQSMARTDDNRELQLEVVCILPRGRLLLQPGVQLPLLSCSQTSGSLFLSEWKLVFAVRLLLLAKQKRTFEC